MRLDAQLLVHQPLRWLAAHPAAISTLAQAREIADAAARKLPAELPVGICHGDVHAGNVSVREAGGVTLFDLDQVAVGPFAYDLACYWRKCVLDSPDSAREWAAFLIGYESERPITNVEREAIPVLATLRAIWVMALPARFVGIWGADWLADPGYFDAHLEMIQRFAGLTLVSPGASRGSRR